MASHTWYETIFLSSSPGDKKKETQYTSSSERKTEKLKRERARK
jgi:hypothetical protein